MTDLERLEKFKEVRDLINGPEAETFLDYWDGRFFNGDMTFIFGETPYNLHFCDGCIDDVKIGQPDGGYYVGLSGSEEQWEDFFKDWDPFTEKRKFQLAISIKHNAHPFKQLGTPLAGRQNQSALAHVTRMIGRVMNAEVK